MKNIIKIILVFCFVISNSNSFSQTLDGYLYSKGVYNISQASHISNDYLEGGYNIYKDYVDISIKSKDNVFGGTVYTDLKLVRGLNGLYFSDIIIDRDTDMVKPFEAFGLSADLMQEVYKNIDSDTYNKICTNLKESFNTDI